MAGITLTDEKAPAAPPQLHLKTQNPQVYEKASSDTLASTNARLSAEKNGAITADATRRSDVSSPRSNHQNPFDTDIEAMITPSMTTEPATRRTTNLSTKCTGGDCQVWPGREHWNQKHKAAKRQRSCNPLGGLSRRNRLIVRILIVLLFIGVALGVGIGISKALGAKY